MRSQLTHSVLLAAALLGAIPGQAGTLSITPVLVNVAAPARATMITMRNHGAETINAQLRLFRWVQIDGRDQLIETRDVAVSPPFAALAPNSEQVSRIVRTSKAPMLGEESYRVLIDQLPGPPDHLGNMVNLVTRHSIPVFFGSPAAHPVALDWSVAQAAGGLRVTAVNGSDHHIRLSDLRLANAAGAELAREDGLFGYVLAGSTATWTVNGAATANVRAGSRIVISATGDQGHVDGVATLR